MTIAEQILSSQLVNSGEWFTVRDLAKHLGASIEAVRFELNQMVHDDLFAKEQDHAYGKARFRRQHLSLEFIYKRPLADTSWME